MLLMGLDVGTTNVKAGIFDENGNMHCVYSQELAIISDCPDRAEQDGETVYQALLSVMGRSVASTSGEIGGISLSVQGDAVAAFDREFRPLTNFQLGMDYRCKTQAAAFAYEFGAENLFRRTGMAPHPINTLCKIRWLTENMPDIIKKTGYYMTFADYLLYRLGSDEPVIDMGMASRTMGFNISRNTWDSELLNAAGIDYRNLSRVVSSGANVGVINPKVSELIGLKGKTSLITGGHDQVCAAVGAGIKSEMGLDSHGTAEAISTILSEPRLDEAMLRAGFPCYNFAAPGAYFTFSLNHTAGLLLKWFVDEFYPGEKGDDQSYSFIDNELKPFPSPLIVLPYFNGRGTPVNDVDMKGLIAGLTLSSDRNDIVRAILEALAYDMNVNLKAMANARLPIKYLRCAGGGAKSPLCLQIKADVCDMPVETLVNREAACFGAALLAGVGIGVYDSIEATVNYVKTDKLYEPSTQATAAYSEKYEKFQQLYMLNKDILRIM